MIDGEFFFVGSGIQFAGLTSLILGKMMGVRRINTDADLAAAIRETR